MRPKQFLIASTRHYAPITEGAFKITSIECNGEYKPIMDEVEDELDVRMNYMNAQDHVPVAERNNRTIKEAVRTALHRLLYKRILKLMIKELVTLCTNRLNWFPAKNGISNNYSPMTIITGKTIDYKKDCVHEFGTYVQAHMENTPQSSMTERSIDGIYLRPNENIQGGHLIMNLSTRKKISRNKSNDRYHYHQQ